MKKWILMAAMAAVMTACSDNGDNGPEGDDGVTGDVPEAVSSEQHKLQDALIEEYRGKVALLSDLESSRKGVYDLELTQKVFHDIFWSPQECKYVVFQALDCKPIVSYMVGSGTKLESAITYPLVAEGGWVSFVGAPLLQGGDLRMTDAVYYGAYIYEGDSLLCEIPGTNPDNDEKDYLSEIKSLYGFTDINVAANKTDKPRKIVLEFRSKDTGKYDLENPEKEVYRYYYFNIEQLAKK